MTRLWLPLVIASLVACGTVVLDERGVGEDGSGRTMASLPPAVFPAAEVVSSGNTVEELAASNPELLQVISDDVLIVNVQHGEAIVQLEKGEQDKFVANLLRSMKKFGGPIGGSSGSTLGDLEPVSLAETEAAGAEPGLEQKADAYREVLQAATAPETRQKVLQRLADLELLAAEARLASGDGSIEQAGFAQAIATYTTLLRENPDNPSNDQVLYQLSRAYSLSGDNEESVAVLERLAARYPQSSYLSEAEFRLAENYFANSDYHRADLAYGRVIELGKSSPHYLNALYMQGWSRFKQGDYRASIAPFIATLDLLLSQDNDVDAAAPGRLEFAQDCQRVLAVVFSNLDGTQSLADTFNELGPRSYEALLYEQLGELYLEQERYRDSAATFKAYASKFPDSKLAPRFQLRVIETYEAGNFPELIVQQKRDYVERFAVTGNYWQQSSEEARSAIRVHLMQFMNELASYYHALAQAEKSTAGDPSAATRHYLAASFYYRLYIDSFPRDPGVPAMAFLLGESRFESGDYAGAISIYEQVAYEHSDYQQAADAAYAAILAYQKLDQAGDGEPDRQRLDSELRFAATFTTDPRAPAVSEHAAAGLLRLEDYDRAAKVAADILAWQPVPADDIMTSAYLVLGHSLFELQQYRDAEQAYQGALGMIPATDQRYAATVDAVAASIYRQAEASVAAGDHQQAAQQFARVMSVAPQSDIRINAQFDAASNFIHAGELEQGNRLLVDFRSRYPSHELSASVAAILVSNYEQAQQWRAAAIELDGIADKQPAAEPQRQALHLAASYYDRAGASELAIKRYRSYANSWPQPVAERMEAMNRLAQLYQVSDQQQKRRYWLKQIVATHEQMGAEQSERSSYLAAFASSVMADDAYREFTAIELRYPLKTSLASKKTAMQRALVAYQKTEAYGVQQFATLATYCMGRIYQQLSIDLLESERPRDIDELASEQYDILLEEQAFPFEEKAIAIYEINARRASDMAGDEWIQASLTALGELVPARYHKLETGAGS
jgi:TolA-binding protein